MNDHWWHSVLKLYTIYINYVYNNISAIIFFWAIITWVNIPIISMGPLRNLFYNMQATGHL